MCVGFALMRIPRGRLGFAYILGRVVSVASAWFVSRCLTRLHSFIWSVSNITLARLILNLRRLSNDAGDSNAEFQDEEDDGVEGTELELPVLRRERGGGQSDSEPHKIL